MASALLAARRRPGQPGVERPPLRRRGALLHDRRDQRVGEAQPTAVAGEHVGHEGRLEARGRLGLHCVGSRVGERRDHAQQRPGVGRQRREPVGEQPSHVGRPRRLRRADQLQRHQRVAAARRVQARERGRRQPLAGPRMHEGGELSGAQRRDGQLERGQAAQQRRERLIRHPGAHRDERPRAAGRQPPQHESEDRGGGRVQPLPVVDREQHVAR